MAKLDLDELMRMPGTLAAFEFSASGELRASRIAEDSALDDTVLDLLSHVCVANTAIATMQARGWENMTGASGFYPITGFTMMGLDWSTITSGCYGLVVDNNKVDYDAAYAALSE